MDLESFREAVLRLPNVSEETPFGPDVLVFKVGGKMFALLGLDNPEPYTNLKCDPDRAEELRIDHPGIRPGYHMSKKHWNSVDLDVGDALLLELLHHSYDLIASKKK
ncbi:MmcQ/YjbR family DNA-binding protein [bacterium]|nr:MmcQ/YjbR family DNA-binding protein [bacterium]